MDEGGSALDQLRISFAQPLLLRCRRQREKTEA
jgi:hypothetical protein